MPSWGPPRERGPRERGPRGADVAHRRYVSYSHAHYGGNLVDGAYVLGLFGNVGTELCMRSDGDEGLVASYSEVQFRAPVRAGDVIEVTATISRAGTRSRDVAFEARGLCRAEPNEAHRPRRTWPSPSSS